MIKNSQRWYLLGEPPEVFAMLIFILHPQTFLEECKYAKENIKTDNYIDEELKSESESESDSDSDNDIDIEE